MGATCQLVRLDPDQLAAIRAEPEDVYDLIDWDEPSDRWADLDRAWEGLFDVLEPRGDPLFSAIFPSAPLFDESQSSGPIVMLGEPDVVREVAEALAHFQPEWPRRRRWSRPAPQMDTEYLELHLEIMRDCYRRAAAHGDAIAVVIG